MAGWVCAEWWLMFSRLRPILGLVLALVFSANAFAPGLHGCEHGASMDRSMAMAGSMAEHHAAGHQHSMPAPGKRAPRGPCKCVDHACCATITALPPSSPVAVVVPQPETRVVVALPAPRPVALASIRLLPPSQGPPSLLA